MATAGFGRVLILNLFVLVQCIYAQEYKIPPVRIQVFKPKGLRASIDVPTSCSTLLSCAKCIACKAHGLLAQDGGKCCENNDPDAPKVALFTFQGNVNTGIGSNDVGDISGEVTEATNGRWVFEDPNVELKSGDVIKYYVFVAVNSKGYLSDGLEYTVTELEDRSESSAGECRQTVTLVRGGSACAGQTIFEDNFDSLRENIWQIEQYIPIFNPEYPFNSYQRLTSSPTVRTSGGYLRITPTVQQNLQGFSNESIYSGTLNLFSGCTAAAEACVASASGADILPPVVSGRVTSKGFAFTYGTVEVRAKLPQGDWLYPEILLEPFLKKYGSQHYASGVLKIASARGNRQLSSATIDYSNKILYGGPIMDSQCHDDLLTSKASTDGKLWGDGFHVYSLRWAPERITLSVDGVEWARVEPTASGLLGRLSQRCSQLPRTLLLMGSAMAPFDDHFYLTLGVAAGSISEFPDGVTTTDGRPKPWTNLGRKAKLFFWQDMNSWAETWRQPELAVDYVKVTAL